MKAKLEFDLSEPEERMEHLRCLKSLDMASTLFQIQYNCKRAIESEIESSGLTNPYDVLDLVFSKIMNEYDDHNINISEILE